MSSFDHTSEKTIVKTTLKDLKENYKLIEKQIEETTTAQRDEKVTRYQEAIQKIESLKTSLKTEINNRKKTEEQLMEKVTSKTQAIENQLTLQYLNQIYQMKEKLSKFEERRVSLES